MDLEFINQQMSLISLIRQLENKIGKSPTLFETLNKLGIDELVLRRDVAIKDYNEFIDGVRDDIKSPEFREAIRYTDNQNMVLVLSRFQLMKSAKNSLKLTEIKIDDILPQLTIAAANANVVIIKDGQRFAVLKHDGMTGVTGSEYHESTIKNIMFARRPL
jgi:hypothetical protein